MISAPEVPFLVPPNWLNGVMNMFLSEEGWDILKISLTTMTDICDRSKRYICRDFSDFYASLIFLTFYSWYISQTHQWNKYDQIYECYIRKKYFLLHATVACIIVRRLLISVHKWQSSGNGCHPWILVPTWCPPCIFTNFYGLNLIIFS